MPGAREAKAGVSLDRSEREAVEPGGDGNELALIRERIPMGRDQIAGLGNLAGRGCMGDCLVDLTAALEPDARASVQAGDDVRLRAFQLLAQQLGEQVVVAKPVAVSIERNEKEIIALDSLQHLRSAAAA